MGAYVTEPQRSTEVFDTCQVLVVGGGPAGVTAAVAAAKNTKGKVVLLERFATLGGMATGGQVLAIPFLSDGEEILVAGIMNEWVDRLRAKENGVFGPLRTENGSTDEEVLRKYRHHGLFGINKIRYGVNCDPAMLQIVLAQMVKDYGITTYCNCLACGTVVEENTIKGVIFESKEGRKAIMADVIIDCTGDGDIFASAGAEFEISTFSTARSSNTALVFRLGGVNYDEYASVFATPDDDPHAELKSLKALSQTAGFGVRPFSSNRNDIMWINNYIPRNCMSVNGLTETAFMALDSAEKITEHLRKYYPGMKDAYILDFASQVGTRGSRRIKGVERFTRDQIAKRTNRDDIVAVMPTLGGQEEYPRMEMPYGILVPEKLDGLLAAGRCFSSDEIANEAANWIPHCIVLGEVAGTAAALSVNNGVQPRALDVKKLQSALKEQGAYLY